MFGGHSFGGAPFGDLSNEAAVERPIFADSWHPPLSRPSFHRVAQAAAIAAIAWSSFVSDPGLRARSEATSPDRWFRPLQEPVRFARALPTAQQQFAAFVQAAPFGEAPGADKWMPPLQVPVRFPRALPTTAQQFAAYVQFAPFAEAVTADRWHPPLSQPVRFPRAMLAAHQTFNVRTTFDTFWFPPLQLPVKFPAALPTARQQFAAFVQAGPFGELIGPDAWHPPLSQPVRFPRALLAAHHDFSLFVDRPVPIAEAVLTIDFGFALTMVPTSNYEQMLSDARARYVYTAVIAPWLLSDRVG